MSLKFRKPTKYRAVATVVDGIRFDSRKEVRRYRELRLLEMVGEVKSLRVHEHIELFAASPQGQAAYLGDYIVDFSYIDVEKKTRIYEDVKSVITRKNPVYRLKKKLAEACHGIRIVEV